MGLFGKREARDRGGGTDAAANQKLTDFIRGTDIDAGGGYVHTVSEEGSLATAAVYACVKVIAESIASLPLHLMREQNKIRERARGHPLYNVLHDLANEEMTSLNFREAMLASLLLRGNAYARIERTDSKVTALWFLSPQNMTISRDSVTKKLVYTYTDEYGVVSKFPPAEIFHIIGFSLDGMTGISPIRQARQTIGLSMATEEYGAKFFSNGARPGGVLETAGVVKDPDRLRASWNAQFQGGRNSHRVAVLEEGVKYHSIGIPPDEAQFLETRKFQLSEICRIFRVPPHMIADLDRATFSNIEHQSIGFVQHTLRPWIVRFEQAVYKCLLTEWERGSYYARFNVDGLMRGDFSARMQGYAIGRQNGWLSANDIRELEDMNPIEGGDAYLVNGNMTAEVGQAKKPVEPLQEAEPPPKSKKAKRPKEDNTD
jgi:HK97 family phage portal protein